MRGGKRRSARHLQPLLQPRRAGSAPQHNKMANQVNGNAVQLKEEEEPMDTSSVTHTEHYKTLIEAGLPQKVAERLDEIFQTGLVSYVDLDERAIDALREFNEEGALSVLQQFKESDLSHVQNKSAFLCGVMKTYRQREKQGSKVQESTKGPDEAKIKALLERTSYTLDVTTGQRKYGGPPPSTVYSGSQPGIGTEVFVGKIPRDLYEDELVPLFEKAGPIWDLRLMMDPLSGQNRGYAFITFCSKDAAQEAVKLCDNYEIRPGKHLGVCISVANNRLFVGSIPKNKTKENILEEFSKVTEGLVDVILYHQPDDKKKNRGFCFLEYEDHKSAAQARRRLMSGKVKVWGNVVTVEWADPVEEPDPEVMAKVKVLFVRNLATTVTEEILEKSFSEFGKLERVKKLKDYAFVHFEDRGAAVKAMNEMNGKEIEGEEIEIVLAKPPDKKRKERQAARQASRSTAYEDYYYYPPPRMPPPIRGRGRGGRGGYGYPPDYYGYEDYYDDYYGYDYHDYRGGYEDPYYGYDDGYAIRGRGGGRGGRGAPPPPRGRGAPPPRGRAGYSQRGAPMGPPRGARGGRGGPAQQQRGRARGARGNRGGNVGGKRKADGYNQPDSKRRQTNNQQNWGSQPIAQQPLQQGGDYAGNYGYNNDNQEFYQDTYGQQWK
ncbi:heterogeneous nuclear ribonucleoprotein R isoform X1 [Candoia aspera]|uniref:heterogeneous nuclear ribonucleoprotein R isoform X1 n=2 Tax=Candoia aspera TaxID=51853 RepID=UPI002FD7E5C2